MPPELGLRARGLRHRWAGRLVLEGLDVDVQPGEVVGLLGPNGAGKTTAFQIISGLVRAERGEVRLDAQPLGDLPLWRRARLGLGYLPQRPSLIQGLSVAENLRVPLEARGVRPGEARRVVAERLADAGLAALTAATAETLSGGERRRVELVRCLLTDPRVILLDEPFAGVDPVAVHDLQGRIRALAERGLGVLITDHAVHATLPVCDRAVVLDAGAVMASGTPSDVAADPTVRARYLGPHFALEPPAGRPG